MAGFERCGFLFSWSIENFSFCPYEPIASPYFADENQWQLELQHYKSSDDIKTSLYSYSVCPEIEIDYTVKIIGPSGRILGVYKEDNVVYNEDTQGKEITVVKRANLMRDILETKKDVITICYYIEYSKGYSIVKALDCTAQTKIIVNKESVRWHWKKDFELTTLLEKENQLISEVTFTLPDSTALYIYFEKKKDDVEITIDNYYSGSSQYVECKISLIDAEGFQVFTISDRFLFTARATSWVLPSFLPTSLLNCNQRKYIKNGIMTILCEFFTSGGIESQSVCYRNHDSKYFAYTNDGTIENSLLKNDVSRLFSDKKLCDINLRVNDEIVQAHKFILAARSPVFYTMFQQNMLETQTGIVNIEDMDIGTLKQFVDFLYSDTVDNMDYDCAKRLLMAAEKYEVLCLKEMCASFLKSNLSRENACEVAAFADMVNHASLKCSALNFIADHSKDILSMPEWFPWMKNHMDLATEIFQKLTEYVTS